ncbi:hypothetical protein [Paraburkholderia sediminicola]
MKVFSQVIEDVLAKFSRALLPQFIAELILSRSPLIGKARDLRIL